VTGADGALPRVRFAHEHTDALVSGEKTLTVRVGDEWADVTPGTRFVAISADGQRLGTATVRNTGHMAASAALAYVNDDDDHRRYRSSGQFYDALRGYYPDHEIGPSTRVHLLWFTALDPTDDALRSDRPGNRRHPSRQRDTVHQEGSR
jgi:hypothetical protein